VISDTINVDYSIDLRLVADVTDASLPDIVALNPSLLRMTTPRDSDFDLHLPPGTKDVFLKRVAGIPEDKRTSWRFHVARPGDSLDSIASSFHMRPSEIEVANRLASNDSIRTGDELVVPVAIAAAGPHPVHYITRVGDTLVTIADRFNVSVDDLRRWNHLSSSAIKPQHTLDVAAPVHLAPVTHVRTKSASTSSKSPVKKSLSSSVTAKKHPATKKSSAPE